MNNIKIAASTYLNSAPLIYGLRQGVSAETLSYQFIGDAAPARCADMLIKRQVNAALIPSIEYQRIENIKLVPGIAVAAKQLVRSVVLVARRPLSEVRSIALDTSSRTSAALVQILLERFYQLRPQYVSFSPSLVDMLELHDAALIIGDPAMTIDRSVYQIYDLAAEWRQATGLPFVFACWAVSDKVNHHNEIVELFTSAKAIGLDACAQIATEYSASLNLSVESLIEYLTENINYELDEENLAGLRRFYELAAECRLIEQVRPLSFIGEL